MWHKVNYNGETQMSERVMVVEEPIYSIDSVEKSIRQIFKELNIYELLKEKRTILVKPNLLGAHNPDKAVTTHPVVLEAVLRLLQELDKEVVVGDSSGGTVKAEQVWEKTGLKAVCQKYEVRLLDLGSEGISTIKTDLKTLNLSKAAVEWDGIINLAKMKTHSLMLYTGAVKNLFGCIPGLGKSDLHKLFPSPDRFALILTKIYELLRGKIILNIIDGIVGMDGDGPSAGRPYPFGILIASKSASAADLVCSKLMGFKLGQLKYLQDSLKLDNLREDEIVIDEKWKNFKYPNVKIKSVIFSNNMLNSMPRFVKIVINLAFSYYPKFPKKCKMCLMCVKCCPVKALQDKDNRIVLDKNKCIKCMCCHEMCPYSLIAFKRKLF